MTRHDMTFPASSQRPYRCREQYPKGRVRPGPRPRNRTASTRRPHPFRLTMNRHPDRLRTSCTTSYSHVQRGSSSTATQRSAGSSGVAGAGGRVIGVPVGVGSTSSRPGGGRSRRRGRSRRTSAGSIVEAAADAGSLTRTRIAAPGSGGGPPTSARPRAAGPASPGSGPGRRRGPEADTGRRLASGRTRSRASSPRWLARGTPLPAPGWVGHRFRSEAWRHPFRRVRRGS